MIIFKALFDSKSKEVKNLFFKENDIILYLAITESSLYEGKNVMTGEIGLFSSYSMSQLNISEDEEKIFVIVEAFDIFSKGDLVIASEIRDCDVIGYLWTDKEKALKNCPLKYLVSLKDEPLNSKFTKSNSTADIKEKDICIDIKNKWICLVDYKSEKSEHLDFVKGEKLKFIDRINHDSVLMQNKSGSVGIVPYNLVKNISVQSRSRKEPISDNGTKIEKSVSQENVNFISDSCFEDTDENVFEFAGINLPEADERERIFEQPTSDLDEYDSITATYGDGVDKKHFTRTKIIEEILETEKKFINDMKLTLRSFNQSEMQNKVSEQVHNSIFGDLKAIIPVSENFYLDFSESVGKCGTDVHLGSIFLKFLPSLESAYKEYYLNYDTKMELISKRQKSQELDDFIKEGLKNVNDSGTSIMNIDAMLVKPLQRFLKYPLFMITIIKNTDEGHADLPDLRIASSELDKIAKKINEKKRFKEISTEIFERNEMWPLKVLHAIKKHPKRAIVTSLYGAQYEDDLDYQTAVSRFKAVKEGVALFVETILFLRDNLKEGLIMYLALIEDLADVVNPSAGSPLSQYILLCQHGNSVIYLKYMQELKRIVVNPLIKLLEIFTGPKMLIKKRKSKFLDYSAMKQKLEEKEVTRVQSDRMEDLKNQYLTINNTLKEELPILTSKSKAILNECIANYLQLTSSIPQSIIEALQNFSANMGVSVGLTNYRKIQTEIMDHLQRSVQTINSKNDFDLVILPSAYPQINRSDSGSRTAHYFQTSEDIREIRKKFDFKDLASVKKDFIPTKSHHINVSVGNIVGILKRQDPNGNTNTWLVEVCSKRKGFVPVSNLNAVSGGNERRYSSYDSDTLTRSLNLPPMKRNSMRNTPNSQTMKPSLSTTLPRKSSTLGRTVFYESRVALYHYQGTGVSMQPNDDLQVIEGCDNLGNTEWSLVINLRTGEEGYVPSNYMSKGPR